MLKAIPLLIEDPLLIVRELNVPAGSVPAKAIATAEFELRTPEFVIFAAPLTLMAAAEDPDADIVPALSMVTVLRVLVVLIPSELAPDVVMLAIALFVIEFTPEVEFN